MEIIRGREKKSLRDEGDEEEEMLPAWSMHQSPQDALVSDDYMPTPGDRQITAHEWQALQARLAHLENQVMTLSAQVVSLDVSLRARVENHLIRRGIPFPYRPSLSAFRINQESSQPPTNSANHEEID